MSKKHEGSHPTASFNTLLLFCLYENTIDNEKRIQSTFIKCAFVPNVTENGKKIFGYSRVEKGNQ